MPPTAEEEASTSDQLQAASEDFYTQRLQKLEKLKQTWQPTQCSSEETGRVEQLMRQVKTGMIDLMESDVVLLRQFMALRERIHEVAQETACMSDSDCESCCDDVYGLVQRESLIRSPITPRCSNRAKYVKPSVQTPPHPTADSSSGVSSSATPQASPISPHHRTLIAVDDPQHTVQSSIDSGVSVFSIVTDYVDEVFV